MTPKKIEEIAKLMVGEHVGWQARFADAAGISRSHLSNILKGSRPVTTDFIIRIYVACGEQAAILGARAGHLKTWQSKIEKLVPAAVAAEPAHYSRAQYEAEADEAIQMINEMVGNPPARGDK